MVNQGGCLGQVSRMDALGHDWWVHLHSGHGSEHCCCLQVVVQLSEDLLSQAVMMVENSRPTLAINLTGARQYWLEGMLRHEIGQGLGRWVGGEGWEGPGMWEDNEGPHPSLSPT